MAELPFIFRVEDFVPLQPEDAELEFARRTDPRWAAHYTNVGVRLWGTPEDESADQPVVTDYNSWVEYCRKMDEEVAQAKQDWRDAICDRDEAIARLRLRCDELRVKYKRLEARTKPPQPRSTRK
jgi:thiol-disulfide isomerase/thioredoxin